MRADKTDHDHDPSSSHFDDCAANWDSDPNKVARALAVAEEIRRRVPLSGQMHALEYGCGTGLLGFALQPYFDQITLADSSPGMLATLNDKIKASHTSNLSSMKLDLVTDPLPAERYDLVCSLMTFHHIDDTRRLLHDLFSLLNSPGYLCVADLDAEDGSFHGLGFTGHKGFDRGLLGHAAQGSGFRNIEFATVFHIAKPDSRRQTDFPVFLMVARK